MSKLVNNYSQDSFIKQGNFLLWIVKLMIDVLEGENKSGVKNCLKQPKTLLKISKQAIKYDFAL
jgi:hypothetical protein